MLSDAPGSSSGPGSRQEQQLGAHGFGCVLVSAPTEKSQMTACARVLAPVTSDTAFQATGTLPNRTDIS